MSKDHDCPDISLFLTGYITFCHDHILRTHSQCLHSSIRQEIHFPDEGCHEPACRMIIDCGRSSDLLDHSLVHYNDPMGKSHGLFLIMCDKNNRDLQFFLNFL